MIHTESARSDTGVELPSATRVHCESQGRGGGGKRALGNPKTKKLHAEPQSQGARAQARAWAWFSYGGSLLAPALTSPSVPPHTAPFSVTSLVAPGQPAPAILDAHRSLAPGITLLSH